MKKSTQAFLIAIITAVIGGGSLFTYNSVVTTNIQEGDTTTTIIEGDSENIFEIDKEDIKEIAIDLNCQLDIIKDPDCP